MIASMMCVGGRCGGGNDIVVVVETNATVLAAWKTLAITGTHSG